MKVIEIIDEAACLLGLVEEQELISKVKEEGDEQIASENKNILSLYNLLGFSVRELCTNYVPVIAEVKISSTDKSYPLGNLENFIRIQNIYKNTEMVKFKIINRNIIFEEDGEFVVSYATYPNISSLMQEIDFLENFSPDAIVFGLCAYYSLSHGMFEEFKDYHERYAARAESLKALRVFELPTRRWE